MAPHVGLNAAQLHDDLLAHMAEGARHDPELCPFCSGSDAAAKTHASGPSGDEPSGADHTITDPTTEGGTTRMTDTATISTETHEALLAKAVADATDKTNQALERKTIEASELSLKKDELETEAAALKQDNDRLNKELDEAQVKLKSASDEIAQLKADIAAKDEAARVAEVASKRAEQVRNLSLFPEEYITEKASSSWAKLSDEDWAERLDEWQKARPADASDGTKKTETASAMTGSSGELTKDDDKASEDDKPPARRAVLGLS